jgi:GT2 family glycosyltransferase
MVQGDGAPLPTVSVLVLNLNGRAYLDACLASLDAQTYPRDRFEVVLVDNGSTDGSIAFVNKKYPRTRVVALTGNQGFCAPYNAAIRDSRSDFVALLNNDTRVDERWLAELVAAADRNQAAAVASRILSWSGETIDFAGGVMSVVGHSWQLDHGQPASHIPQEKRILFPCAGSALFSRSAFLDAGAFDEEFFAYFEDVDLGWRLNAFGERVVLAPKAVTYHRVHGTSSRWAFAQRLRLLERNALAMIYKNYEAVTLERVLPAAIGLLLLRATMRSGVEKLKLDLSDRPPDLVTTHPYLAAHLLALEDFCRQLPALKRKREAIQRRRRVSDRTLFGLFVEPLRLHEDGELYEAVARELIHEFAIDELVGAGSVKPPRTPPRRRAGETAKAAIPDEPPLVSIIILTALGATHLGECLESLRRQTYPADRVELIVVDNGSRDDPTAAILSMIPNAHIIRNRANAGFAAGNNQGAAVATGKYLVFLNDDTRLHPDWLTELVATARRQRAAAVASCILDWSGDSVDFVDGAVNFEGKGFQLQYGEPASGVTLEEKPLLFACGCAMLIDRGVLAEAGGWDAGAFAYYEDLELGWRLRALGHDVWLSPRSIVYHKHHGTSARWAEPPRLRLYERNSLRAIYEILGAAALQRALPAALMLAADRALLETGLSRAADSVPPSRYARSRAALKGALVARGINRSTTIPRALERLWGRGFLSVARDVWRLYAAGAYRSRREAYLIERGGMPFVFDAQGQPIPIAAAAILSGIYGFLVDLPRLAERRAALQERRLVSDYEILSRFGTHWLEPTPARHPAVHQALRDVLLAELDVAAVIRPPKSAVQAATDRRPVLIDSPLG